VNRTTQLRKARRALRKVARMFLRDGVIGVEKSRYYNRAARDLRMRAA
jgi:hypothetical protein